MLKIANLISCQRIMGKQYSMIDPRMTEAISEITASFCNRTFGNMMPLVLEVLNKMTKNYDLEKETICVSYGKLFLT